MALLKDYERLETANFLRQRGTNAKSDTEFMTMLATRFCGTVDATRKDVAYQLAKLVEPQVYEASESVKVDMFELANDSLIAITGKELKRIYEEGVYRGAYDVPKANLCKCLITGEVLRYGTTNALD